MAAFAAVYVIWGSTYLAIRFAVETIPPFSMAGVRFLVDGGVLYAGCRAKGVTVPTRAQWQASAVAGVLLLLGGNGAVVWAEQWVPSGAASLLVATVPFWMVLLEWLSGQGDRPRATVASGLLAGILGVWLLVGDAAAGLSLAYRTGPQAQPDRRLRMGQRLLRQPVTARGGRIFSARYGPGL